MSRIYASDSFCKRMIAGGVLGPILAVAAAYLIAGKSPAPVRDVSLLSVLMLAFFAMTVVAATYYWRVTLYMITQGIVWCVRTVITFFENLSYAALGIIVLPFGLIFSALMILVCLVIAVGPYVLIPLGGLWLETLAFSGDNSVLQFFLFGGIGLANLAWIVFLHFVLPIRSL